MKIVSVFLFTAQIMELLHLTQAAHSRKSKFVREKVISVYPYASDDGKILLEKIHDYNVLLKMDNKKAIPFTREFHVSIASKNKYSQPTGIMAIVQKLNMRTHNFSLQKNSEVVSNAGMCQDYIQFFSVGRGSEEICGFLLTDDRGLNNSKLIGERAFYTEHSSLDFILHISNDTRGHQKNDSMTLKIEISFTAYTKVCNGKYKNVYNVAPCGGANSTCISSHLFCNGIIECGFGKEFASDESNCNSCLPCKIGVIVVFVCIAVFLKLYVLKKKMQKRQYPTVGTS